MVRNPAGPFDSGRRKGSHSLPHQSAFAGYSLGLMGVIFGSMQFQKRSWWAVLLRATRMFSSQPRNNFSFQTPGLLDMIPSCEANLRLMAGSAPL